MGNFYLFCALIVAVFIAIFAPRAGLIMGAGLFVLGLLPSGWILFAHYALGIQMAETDGMLMTLAAFYLSAPGFMLGVGSLIGLGLGLDRA